MSAMHRQQFVSALGMLLMVGGGCHVPQLPAAAALNQEQIRVNCYSLMHDLLDQQKNVDKLLLIKFESAELHSLIKTIASASEAGAKKLKEFAAKDRSLSLEQLALPPGEIATRKSIAREKAKQLLASSGARFELNLLLTQAEALSYATHLSRVAAANEPEPGRARYLSAFSEEMKELHRRAISLIRSQPESGPRKG